MDPQTQGRQTVPDAEEDLIPPVRHWFVRGFTRYSTWRLRKAFHQVRITKESFDASSLPAETPLIVYSNHSSWWDPLMALVLRKQWFKDRIAFAPIDGEMLEKYGIFKPLGFFGIDRKNPLQGTKKFLRQSAAILEVPGHMLWLTPQGRFADIRERPVTLEAGLSALAKRIPEARFIPAATEYTFWEESAPEILLHIGPPCDLTPDDSREETGKRLAQALEEAQDQLAEWSMARQSEAFQPLLSGSAGSGAMWDLWTRLKGALSGKSADTRHSKL